MQNALFWNLKGVNISQKQLSALVRKYLPRIVAIAEPFLLLTRMRMLQSRLNMVGSVLNEEVGGKLRVMWVFGM